MKLIRVMAGMLGAVLLAASAAVLAQQPLKIGFGMSLTGPLAGNGKAALIAMEIWRDDVNKKNGILGRKVEFVYYDDRRRCRASTPSSSTWTRWTSSCRATAPT
jgi:branched-chain amino acid transport system substrate-binding protein